MGRPKTIDPTEPCPCGGKETWSWHRRHRRAQCQASVDYQNKSGNRFWIPGTSIFVPEYEEP